LWLRWLKTIRPCFEMMYCTLTNRWRFRYERFRFQNVYQAKIRGGPRRESRLSVTRTRADVDATSCEWCGACGELAARRFEILPCARQKPSF
jgi:hypothetical protein